MKLRNEKQQQQQQLVWAGKFSNNMQVGVQVRQITYTIITSLMCYKFQLKKHVPVLEGASSRFKMISR